MKLKFYSDPSHSWLKVPTKLLEELGIGEKITSYSYYRAGFAYLEEDQDWSTFHEAMEKAGRKYESVEGSYSNDRSRVRQYRSYQPFFVTGKGFNSSHFKNDPYQRLIDWNGDLSTGRPTLETIGHAFPKAWKRNNIYW